MAETPDPPWAHLQHPPLEKVHGHSLLIVRLIALGKIFKALCLVVVGGFILHTLQKHTTAHDALLELINALRVDENGKYIHAILEKSLGISPETMRLLSLGTLVYAALYLVEGLGLLWDKLWAEWMLVITTAGFIPLEIYEISRHATIVRIVVFILNLLALVYIALRLRWRHLAHQEARELGQPYVSPRQTTRKGIKP